MVRLARVSESVPRIQHLHQVALLRVQLHFRAAVFRVGRRWPRLYRETRVLCAWALLPSVVDNTAPPMAKLTPQSGSGAPLVDNH